MHSIRTKMTGITIAAILTTLLAVFLVCYSTFLEENDRRSVEMMNLIGRNTQQSLEAYLGDITQSVEPSVMGRQKPVKSKERNDFRRSVGKSLEGPSLRAG